MQETARHFYISGQVQGVGFRFFARHAARRLGVDGYVKNLRDGRVEVYAIGSPEALRVLRSELERGPHSAVIEQVAEQDAPIKLQYEGGFTIEHDD